MSSLTVNGVQPQPARLPTLREVERQVIEYRLELFKGNKTAVARSLGISLKTLYNRLNGYKAADAKAKQP